MADPGASFIISALSYGEVWARRNVYSAPPRYYKCTATHGTPSGTHGGPWGVVQQIPKGGVQYPRGGLTLNPNPSYMLLAMGRYGPGVVHLWPMDQFMSYFCEVARDSSDAKLV